MTSTQIDDNFDSIKNRGNDNFKAKNFKAAIEDYSDAIRIREDEPTAYSNRAQCYLYMQQYFDALRDCDTAIKLNPSFTKAYYRRAIALKNLHRYCRALEDFEKVAELDPTFKAARDEVDALKSLLERDTRIELKPMKKRETHQTTSEMKTFALNNHYSGSLQYQTR